MDLQVISTCHAMPCHASNLKTLKISRITRSLSHRWVIRPGIWRWSHDPRTWMNLEIWTYDVYQKYSEYISDSHDDSHVYHRKVPPDGQRQATSPAISLSSKPRRTWASKRASEVGQCSHSCKPAPGRSSWLDLSVTCRVTWNTQIYSYRLTVWICWNAATGLLMLLYWSLRIRWDKPLKPIADLFLLEDGLSTPWRDNHDSEKRLTLGMFTSP